LQVLIDCDKKRVEQEREHAELIGGFVCATVANYAGKILEKTEAKPADFMPSRIAKGMTRSRTAATPEQAVTNIRCFLKGQMQAQIEAGIGKA
jgi:hypothetical protein